MREGWNRDELSQISDVLNDLQRVNYEIDNCIRGAFTYCNTHAELGEHIGNLARRLLSLTEDLGYIDDMESREYSED